MGVRKFGLLGTIVLAVVAVVSVSSALLTYDTRATGADALRTGGFAGGSIIAMYALWLNDRRRRVEERRQDLELRRTDLDRDRVADERFARSVELLGHEADQVRVGAMHALAGLARSNPEYTQTALDVLCSYLRRPFQHPRYEGTVPFASAEDALEWSLSERNQAERRLQVRLTAQRLIVDLLPAAGDADAPAYDLDLTNASLEYFDLVDRKVGSLVLRYANLHSSSNFSRCEFVGPVWYTGTVFAVSARDRLPGRFRCNDAVFRDRAWFSGVEFHGPAQFDRTRVLGRAKFSGSTFHDIVSMMDSHFEGPAFFDRITFESDVALSSTTWHDEVTHDDISIDPDQRSSLPAGWLPSPVEQP